MGTDCNYKYKFSAASSKLVGITSVMNSLHPTSMVPTTSSYNLIKALASVIVTYVTMITIESKILIFCYNDMTNVRDLGRTQLVMKILLWYLVFIIFNFYL